MKKKVFGKKLGRSFTAKRALFRSLTRAIVINGEIVTTRAKAKAVRGYVEDLIKTAAKGDISSKRRVYGKLANDRWLSEGIFKLADNFKSQKGGYLKIINMPARLGDNARLAKISWSQKIEEPKKSVVKKESKKDVKEKEKKPLRSLGKLAKNIRK